MIPTPNCDKLAKAAVARDFLDWLRQEGLTITKWRPYTPAKRCPYNGQSWEHMAAQGLIEDFSALCPGCGTESAHSNDRTHDVEAAPVPSGYAPLPESADALLYRFLDIDATELERERRALIEACVADTIPPISTESSDA